MEVINKFHPILLIDLHSPDQDVAVGKVMFEQGYTVFRTTSGMRIVDLTRGWPSPDGIWGQIIAFH